MHINDLHTIIVSSKKPQSDCLSVEIDHGIQCMSVFGPRLPILRISNNCDIGNAAENVRVQIRAISTRVIAYFLYTIKHTSLNCPTYPPLPHT